jgi:uncharacterized protein (DUF58 family)
MEDQGERLPTLFVIPLMQFFVGLSLFIALLNGQRDLALLSLLVLGMAGGAKLWSRRGLSALKCDSSLDRVRVFPGEKITLKVRAENAKFLPIWLQMEIPADAFLAPSSPGETLKKESGLLWYQRATFRWELTARRRGFHRIGPPRIRVADLLGFYPREREAEEPIHVIVYPRLVPLKSFPLPRRDFFGIPGAKSPVEDPVYILGARDYQHWRPARYIHWKASARHGRLQEKVFEPSEQEKVLLLVEVEQFPERDGEEDFERTLEIAASAAVLLEGRGCAVGLATNGLIAGGGPAIVPVARGPRQLSAVLEVLARVQAKPSGEMGDILKRGMNLPWGVTCLHFSCGRGAAARVTGGILTLRKIPTVLIVSQVPSTAEGDESGTGRCVYTHDEIRVTGMEGQ